MADYTVLNLTSDVPDMGQRFGYAPNMEARFAREPLKLEKSGVSYFKLAPGFRVPFGHRHAEQEEVYVVLGESARVKHRAPDTHNKDIEMDQQFWPAT